MLQMLGALGIFALGASTGPTITTSFGDIHGVVGDAGVAVYSGIPYAQGTHTLLSSNTHLHLFFCG